MSTGYAAKAYLYTQVVIVLIVGLDYIPVYGHKNEDNLGTLSIDNSQFSFERNLYRSHKNKTKKIKPQDFQEFLFKFTEPGKILKICL